MKQVFIVSFILSMLFGCSPHPEHVDIFVDGSSTITANANGSRQFPYKRPEQAFKILWKNGDGNGSEGNRPQRIRIHFRAIDTSGNPITYFFDSSDAPIHIHECHDFQLIGGWPGESQRPILDGGSVGSGDSEIRYGKMNDAFHRFRFMNCHHFRISNFVFRNFQFSAILVVYSSHFEISNNLILPVYNICHNLDGSNTRFGYGTQSIGVYMCNEASAGYELSDEKDYSYKTGTIHDNIVISEPISNAHNWGIYFTGGVNNVAVFRNILLNAGMSCKSIHGTDFQNPLEAGAFHNILVSQNVFCNCRTGLSLYDGNPTDPFWNENVIVEKNWFKAGDFIHWKWEFEDDCYAACPGLANGTEMNHCWSHGSMIKNIGLKGLRVFGNLFDFSDVNMNMSIRHEDETNGSVSELRVFQFTPDMYYSFNTEPENLTMSDNFYLFKGQSICAQAVQALYTAETQRNRISFENWKCQYDTNSSVGYSRSVYEQKFPRNWYVLCDLWKKYLAAQN